MLLRICLVSALALTPAAASAAPLFVEATARLGSPQPCGPGDGEGCYSNYVVMADLDGDADLDLLFASGGGYYVPNDAQPMALYLNDGAGQFTESSATATGGFIGRLRQVAVGDIDGDGDLDIVAPDAWAMQPDAVFVNNGAKPPVFADQGAARLGTSSRAGATRLADVDDDGDLDLLITDWGDAPPDSPGTARLYRNDGSGTFTEAAGAIPQDTATIGTGPIDADFFDADNDFDLDLVLASRIGESLFFVNDGAGTFSDGNARLPDQSGPYVYGPDECDVDNDGDLDVWLDNGADPLAEQLVINDGTGTFTDETATRVTDNPANADDNEVQCADLDGDGDLDAIVASLADNERMLRNDGTGKFAGLTDAFPAVTDSTLGLDLGDVDGDLRLDAVTAQGEGGVFLNRLYLGVAAQPVDSRGPRFRIVQTDFSAATPAAAVIHFAVVDATTTDVGPRLQKVYVQRTTGGDDVPARFMGGDLFRAVVDASGTAPQCFRACAIDAAGNLACSVDVEMVFAGGQALGCPATPDAGPGPGLADAGPDAPDGGPDAGPGGPKDDGCGCRVAGRPRGGAPAALLLLGLAALLVRRRR